MGNFRDLFDPLTTMIRFAFLICLQYISYNFSHTLLAWPCIIAIFLFYGVVRFDSLVCKLSMKYMIHTVEAEIVFSTQRAGLDE